MQMRTVPLPHSGLLHNSGIELASPNLGAIVRPLWLNLMRPTKQGWDLMGAEFVQALLQPGPHE